MQTITNVNLVGYVIHIVGNLGSVHLALRSAVRDNPPVARAVFEVMATTTTGSDGTNSSHGSATNSTRHYSCRV